MDFVNAIKRFTTAEIYFDEPMKNHTGYGLGGSAKYFIEVKSSKDIKDVVEFCCELQIPYKIIGNGTNVVFSDKGYKGAVISTKKHNKISFNNDLFIASSGARIQCLFNLASENGYSGFEALSDIPALVGGATVMNASAYNTAIADFIVYVDVLSKNGFSRQDKEICGFRYRGSKLLDDKNEILSVAFKFNKNKLDGDETNRYKKIRCLTQPKGRSCGSVFQNPEGDFAGRIIDELGLKGYRYNGAYVSPLHGNFILTNEGAKAQDVYNLTKIIKQKVKEKLGIKLVLEIEFIGEF